MGVQPNGMMFGTTQKMQMVRIPSAGMNRNRVGFSQSNQLENGGLDVYRPSMTTHFEYKMDFGIYEATGSGGLDVFGDYASGFYGKGLIYLADPMYYDVNLFAPQFAAPGLTERPYSLSGVGGPTATAANSFNQPFTSMITFIDVGTANNAYDLTYYNPTIIPIPTGYTLWLGFSGSVTDGGLIRTEQWVSGAASPAASANLTALSATASTRFNASFSGATYDYVKIGYSRNAGTAPQVTVTSMMAQLWPTGVSPTLTGSFQTGQGADGLKFLDAAIQEPYLLRDNTGRNIHYKGLSFSLGEVGTWV